MAFTPQNQSSAVYLSQVTVSPDGDKVVYTVFEPTAGEYQVRQLIVSSYQLLSKVVNNRNHPYGLLLTCSKMTKSKHPKLHRVTLTIVNHNGIRIQRQFIF